MTDFLQVDCDSHIQELPDTWELYLDEAFAARRPQVIDNPHVSHRPYRNKTWLVDGNLIPKNQGHGGVVMSTPANMEFARQKQVPIEIQGCSNPEGRVGFMKEAGIHKSVLFSTLFLQPLTDDLVFEAALMRAWNRWMGDVAKKTDHHLEFGAPVPIRDTKLAIQEMLAAKELGACCLMLLPGAGDRLLHDPALDPFWAEAEAIDMPITVHIGWPNPRTTHDCFDPMSIFLGAFDTSSWWGYLSILCGGILDKFPKLKVAFLENDAKMFEVFLIRAMHWFPTSVTSPWPAKMSAKDYLEQRQVYFSFEGDYKFMPEFMELVGEDRIMAALDFPHTHYGVGANLSVAFDLVRNHETLTDTQKRKALRDNAVAFYGFTDA